MFQDLSTWHDRPVKKAVVVLPIRLKENSKHTSCNSFESVVAQYKDLGPASETLLTGVKLHFYSSINNEEKSAWEKP